MQFNIISLCYTGTPDTSCDESELSQGVTTLSTTPLHTLHVSIEVNDYTLFWDVQVILYWRLNVQLQQYVMQWRVCLWISFGGVFWSLCRCCTNVSWHEQVAAEFSGRHCTATFSRSVRLSQGLKTSFPSPSLLSLRHCSFSMSMRWYSAYSRPLSAGSCSPSQPQPFPPPPWLWPWPDIADTKQD